MSEFSKCLFLLFLSPTPASRTFSVYPTILSQNFATFLWPAFLVSHLLLGLVQHPQVQEGGISWTSYQPRGDYCICWEFLCTWCCQGEDLQYVSDLGNTTQMILLKRSLLPNIYSMLHPRITSIFNPFFLFCF